MLEARVEQIAEGTKNLLKAVLAETCRVSWLPRQDPAISHKQGLSNNFLCKSKQMHYFLEE